MRNDGLISSVKRLAQDKDQNAVALALQQIDEHLKSLDKGNQLALLRALYKELVPLPSSLARDTIKDCVLSLIEHRQEK